MPQNPVPSENLVTADSSCDRPDGMATEHTVLFRGEAIAEKVIELAARIDGDHGDDGVVVIVVLKGAAIFAADLVRVMETETEVVYLTASSYVDGFTPGESLSLGGDLDLDVGGRDVLIVDDIIDTGRTLKELSALLAAAGPRRVATVAFVSKTSRRSPDSEPDYHGLEIGDEFIYGYGLDWDERYRDLPFIALANP
jgi:hypoxanthine phosphoribosyltransferase